METLRILCLALVALLQTARPVSTLSCYSCESLDEGGCGDPFFGDLEAVECDLVTSPWPQHDLRRVFPGIDLRATSIREAARSFAVCAKAKFVLKGYDDVRAVMRGCSPHGNDTCQATRDFLVASNLATNDSEIVCKICTDDECNVGSSLKPFVLLASFLVALGLCM